MSHTTPGELERRRLFSRYGSRPSFSIQERSIYWALKAMAWLTIFVTVSVVLVLLKDAVVFFEKVSLLDFFFGTAWEPVGEPKKLGVLPLVAGTLMVALGAISIAVPLGLGTAVYLTQFSNKRIRDILGPIVEILGGVPTVVYGYFALTAVTPVLGFFFPQIQVFNALSAAIVVGIAVIPMISSLSADALQMVPASLGHAGYALGMSKFHVVNRIMIPAATSGIVSSFILAFARAIGETMIVSLAAGSTPNLSFNYLEGIQTITGFIVQISLGDTEAGSIEYYTIYALGLTLFLMTLFFNILASRIVRRFQEKYQ
ncbi:MAG: phosphate ABC transporter permease subunit PstC [Leptospiraceae bacterium]|nr:phosphate ABC transporter permease subunit PstC [Leptospiraceae bacterium]